MVASQHALLTKVLHIPHVRAVMGISMGGMQTFQWILTYPTFMDRAVTIVGSPQLAPYDLLLWQSQLDAIFNDPEWKGGDYAKQPLLRAVQEIQDLALTTPEHYNRLNTRQTFLDGVAKRVPPTLDANDRVRQLQAMVHHDVAAPAATPFGGSLAKAAAQVKTSLLVVVDARDHMVTPGPALEFAAAAHARVLKEDTDCGHLLPSCGKRRSAPPSASTWLTPGARRAGQAASGRSRHRHSPRRQAARRRACQSWRRMADVVVSDLTKSFDEGGASRAVLCGVSFEVRSGELVAIVGRSGSGKSTLLNLIAGIDRPSGGSVRIGGRDISALNERDRTLFRRASIGFVFQFFNLLPTLTVEENVRLPLELGRGSRGAGVSRLGNCCRRWVWVIAPTIFRIIFRGASSSAWPSRGRLSMRRRWCSLTNPRARLTPKMVGASSNSWSAWRATAAPRSCWSPTAPTWPARPIAFWWWKRAASPGRPRRRIGTAGRRRRDGHHRMRQRPAFPQASGPARTGRSWYCPRCVTGGWHRGQHRHRAAGIRPVQRSDHGAKHPSGPGWPCRPVRGDLPEAASGARPAAALDAGTRGRGRGHSRSGGWRLAHTGRRSVRGAGVSTRRRACHLTRFGRAGGIPLSSRSGGAVHRHCRCLAGGGGGTVWLRVGGRRVALAVVAVHTAADDNERLGLDHVALVDISSAQELLAMPGHLSRIDVRVGSRIDSQIDSMQPSDPRTRRRRWAGWRRSCPRGRG